MSGAARPRRAPSPDGPLRLIGGAEDLPAPPPGTPAAAPSAIAVRHLYAGLPGRPDEVRVLAERRLSRPARGLSRSGGPHIWAPFVAPVRTGKAAPGRAEQPADAEEFSRAYAQRLQLPRRRQALRRLVAHAGGRPLVLLYSDPARTRSAALVLAEALRGIAAEPPSPRPGEDR